MSQPTAETIGRIILMEVKGHKIIQIQLDPTKVLRVALYKTEPKLGVMAVEMLPEILRKHREELELPEFDEIVIRPTTHRPEEADIELRFEGNIVAEFSVKFSPTGNLKKAIESWRREGRRKDLILLLFARAQKGGATEYFIAAVVVPKELEILGTSGLAEAVKEVLQKKAEEEGYDAVWVDDAREIAAALRDYEVMKKLNEISRKQDEMIALQRETVKKLDQLIELFRELLKRSES